MLGTMVKMHIKLEESIFNCTRLLTSSRGQSHHKLVPCAYKNPRKKGINLRGIAVPTESWKREKGGKILPFSAFFQNKGVRKIPNLRVFPNIWDPLYIYLLYHLPHICYIIYLISVIIFYITCYITFTYMPIFVWGSLWAHIHQSLRLKRHLWILFMHTCIYWIRIESQQFKNTNISVVAN